MFLLSCVLGTFTYASGTPYGVVVSATPPKVAEPGEIVTHVFTVRNTGTQDDIYLLEVEVPEGWDYFPKQTSISVPAGEEGYVFVNLIVPDTVPAGTYRIGLRATSSGDPSVSAEAITSVEVLPRRGIEFRWLSPPTRLQVGRKATWGLSLENTGNVPDAYRLELEAQGPLKASLAEREVHLSPGGETAVEIRIEVSPRAEPGAAYSLRVSATSLHDPSVRAELRASGRFLPPPPGLVPRSLFPQWEVTLGVRTDSEEGPSFSFRGSGDIELFDYRVDAGLEVTPGELGELRLSWEGKGKVFYLHGGGIAGLFLGVSGKPLFGGEIEGVGRWRLLFTEEAKGLSFTAEKGDGVFNFALGSDGSISFQDVDLRWTPTGGLSIWGSISRGADTSSTGDAVRVGGKVSRKALDIEASYVGVSPGYPEQSPRDELILRWEGPGESLRGTYRFSILHRGLPEGDLFSHKLELSVSPGGTPRPRIDFGYIRRFSNVNVDVDEWSFFSTVSMRGKGLFSWAFTGKGTFKEDIAAGTTALTLSLAGGIGMELGGADLSANFGISSTTAEGSGPPTSSLAIRIRFPGTMGNPSISFQVEGEKNTLSISLWDIPAGEGAASGELSYVLEGGLSHWKAGFRLQFPTDFPFLGPTRGRIRGRVFLDRDGDRRFGPGDKGLGGILLSADGAEAVSGEGGIFLFPPLLPGEYRLSFEELPPEFVPETTLPTVEVKRGKEVFVEIPLRPRAWLRGVVFLDADRDGRRDPGEEGIGGVELVVTGETGKWEVETDPSGLFSLELPPGRYEVRLLKRSLPKRCVLTTPEAVRVEVPEYGVAEVNFGAYRKPRPVVVTFAPPVAAFTYSPRSPRAGEPVRFSGAKSHATNARIVDYRWEFRLGSRRITAQGEEVTVVFPTPGKWTVILIVTDSNGLVAAARGTVEVLPAPG